MIQLTDVLPFSLTSSSHPWLLEQVGWSTLSFCYPRLHHNISDCSDRNHSYLQPMSHLIPATPGDPEASLERLPGTPTDRHRSRRDLGLLFTSLKSSNPQKPWLTWRAFLESPWTRAVSILEPPFFQWCSSSQWSSCLPQCCQIVAMTAVAALNVSHLLWKTFTLITAGLVLNQTAKFNFDQSVGFN